jgi:hypothetical protein
MSDGEDGKPSSPPGWYPYGEGRQAWWDGEAFGPFAPLASSRRLQPEFEPYKPRLGKHATIPLVLLGLFLTGGLIVGLANLDYTKLEDLTIVDTVQQPEIANPADGCVRMHDFLKGLQRSASMTDHEVAARLRGLRDAAGDNDPKLANDVQELLEAADEIKARDIYYRILGRCESAGALTPDQLAEIGVGPETDLFSPGQSTLG